MVFSLKNQGSPINIFINIPKETASASYASQTQSLAVYTTQRKLQHNSIPISNGSPKE